MPHSSAMRAILRQSGQVACQRSGTNVAVRAEEQFAPNRPIFKAFLLYISTRWDIDPGSIGEARPSMFSTNGTTQIITPFGSGYACVRSDDIAVWRFRPDASGGHDRLRQFRPIPESLRNQARKWPLRRRKNSLDQPRFEMRSSPADELR